MAQQFDNEERGRYRRNPPREEGFIDRVRDWFRDRVDEFDRGPSERSRENPGRRTAQQDWRRSQNRYHPNRDDERAYRSQRGYGTGDSEWERTRQWRRDWSQENLPRQSYERNTRYGYGRDYRDEERMYGLGNDYRYRRNRDYDSNFDQDYRPRGGAYPSAGMGADYGSDFDYTDQYDEDENVNYGEGDVGYESEGAFYQDLDEPKNFRSQVYRYGTQRSPYLGVGPQGYRRSDERIRDDIYERLTRHGRIDARQVRVEVKDGEVTLQGKVPYREMKRLAEDTAENVSGVTDVRNEIKVEQRDRPSWDNPENRRRESNWEDAQTQNRQQNWANRAEADLEGLEASGQTNTGTAASLEDLTATTQPTRTNRNISVGMEVIGTNGKVVGTVKEVRQNDFLVDREMARDVYVPFSAISMVGEQVMLNVTANDVDIQDWEKPNLF